MLKINDLIYFVKVAETGNMTKAAEQLYVSQPAVSHSIKSLEKEIGTELFTRRDRNRIEINPAGQIVLRHAKAILENIEQIKSEVSQLEAAEKPVRFSVQAAAPVIDKFVQYYKNNISNLTVDYILDEEDDTWDIRLFSSMENIRRENISKVMNEKIVAVMSNHHSLASKAMISREDIMSSTWITLPKGKNLRKTIDEYCRIAAIRPASKVEAKTAIFMLECIIGNMGIGLLPQLTWVPADNEITIRAIDDPLAVRTLYIEYNRNSHNKNAEALGRYLTQHFEQYLKETLKL